MVDVEADEERVRWLLSAGWVVEGDSERPMKP